MHFRFLIREYLPELTRVQAVKEASLAAKKAASMQRMMADLKVDRAQNPAAFANDRWEGDEDDEEEDIDVDLNDPDIIDRSTLLRLLSHSCADCIRRRCALAG